jgi:16S rRNA (cytidine1402-2'-O)-methyltransferase
MTKQHGKLYLIPTPIGTSAVREIPLYNINVLKTISIFIVEELRTARRFLAANDCKELIDKSIFIIHNEHSEKQSYSEILAPIFDGKNIGILSEAGMPCIADPGEEIVSEAHNLNIDIIPLVGPSSILLALVASGLNGESFKFHGYLPIDKFEKEKTISNITNDIQKTKTSHIFIETPYRNNHLIESILKVSPNNLKLCIAANILGESQSIKTKSIHDWKKIKFDYHKIPTIFILGE